MKLSSMFRCLQEQDNDFSYSRFFQYHRQNYKGALWVGHGDDRDFRVLTLRLAVIASIYLKTYEK